MKAYLDDTSSYTFQIVVHGTLEIIVINQTSLEILVPYDNCHAFIAACLDQNCHPIWQFDLQRTFYTIRNVTAGQSPSIGPNDPSRLVVNHRANGSNAWCHIVGLRWPEQVIPWRRFSPNILDPSSQTYKANGLHLVDGAGIPTVYAIHYSGQSGPYPEISTSTGSIQTITPTAGVARLHIFAESPTDKDHDALATLNAMAHPAFDLGLNGGNNSPAPVAPPPSPVSSLAHCEQYALCESYVNCPTTPPCFSMKEQVRMESEKSVSGHAKGHGLGRPRTCIPLIGVRG